MGFEIAIFFPVSSPSIHKLLIFRSWNIPSYETPDVVWGGFQNLGIYNYSLLKQNDVSYISLAIHSFMKK